MRRTVILIAVLGGFVGVVAASRSKAAPKASAPALPEVTVLRLAGEDVAIYREYPARTYARDLVEVRGRVDGYIERRLFEIGSDVRPGQILYVLDLRPYEAEVERARGAAAQATADVAQAEAVLLKSRQDVARLEPLVKEEAAPRQDLDNALTGRQAAEAAVSARKAALEANRAILRTAELNLEYATIRAPIGGRIGETLLQVGGLVTKSSSQPLTTIAPLDPMWLRFQANETELALFSRVSDVRSIDLIVADSEAAVMHGRIQNTLNSVNTKTGTLEVQASFRNPDHLLLPGQFVRVRVQAGRRSQALLVPEGAVQQLQGRQSVWTLASDGTVQAHDIVAGDRAGDRVVVEQGLKPGDAVIIDGLQRVRPGARAVEGR